MFCVVGDRGIWIEPVFYWPDARELAMHLPKGTADVLQRHGAVHFQIGRYYEYPPALYPSARLMLRAFKRLEDPKGIMNPDVLGLD